MVDSMDEILDTEKAADLELHMVYLKVDYWAEWLEKRTVVSSEIS